MAISSTLLSFLLFSISMSSLTTYIHATGSFHVDLIHRDSPKSPIYNPAISSSDRFLAAARRSMDRANYFQRSLSQNSTAFHSDVIPGSFEYLMTIDIGSPAFKVHAIADTGSDLIWTQCQPCTDCYNQTDPIFDPTKSSTYKKTTCNSTACSALPEFRCSGGSGDCQYLYSYGDQSTTIGILSTETFTFDSDDDKRRNAVVPNVLFGCSHDSEGTFDASGGGLVGLGGGPLSLTSQLGPSIDNKFSYCLVPYSDRTATSLLSFGGNGKGFGGQATPLASSADTDTDTFYYLTLESVGVGNKTVSTSNSEGNIIIDSGTTLTLIDGSLLQPLVDGLKEVVSLPIVADPDGVFELCFDVSGESGVSLDALPSLQFGFRNAPITLPPMNSFVEIKEGTVCLAIASSDSIGINIFGNIAQQNFLIGYDLKAREVYFEPKDCTKP